MARAGSHLPTLKEDPQQISLVSLFFSFGLYYASKSIFFFFTLVCIKNLKLVFIFIKILDLYLYWDVLNLIFMVSLF